MIVQTDFNKPPHRERVEAFNLPVQGWKIDRQLLIQYRPIGVSEGSVELQNLQMMLCVKDCKE